MGYIAFWNRFHENVLSEGEHYKNVSDAERNKISYCIWILNEGLLFCHTKEAEIVFLSSR
ncbi:hypothetical protein AAG94_07095 [Escherichia albertii]|nr:hypothetical protein [Escherichia albertii]EFO0970114.1 hypothetical protein [Escherichia albertii]EFO4718353.1 hypothetical protein [Escherichia albertii]